MSRDSGPVVGLEQACVRPGHWLIEGYDVMRMTHNSPRRRWEIMRFGKWVHEVPTLAEARDWIANGGTDQAAAWAGWKGAR